MSKKRKQPSQHPTPVPLSKELASTQNAPQIIVESEYDSDSQNASSTNIIMPAVNIDPKNSQHVSVHNAQTVSTAENIVLGTSNVTAEPSKTTATTTASTTRVTGEDQYYDLRHCIVSNDGSHDNLVKLIGLKSLFAKQLPKMPKEYIVRLVFDRRHKSLAILNDDPSAQGGDEEIIGGICYRPYPEMRFAEIAFCAVNGSQQVKGYGTKLMNLLKMNAVKEGLEYLITYADNYAIGYFKKQGFTKTITMPKGRYHGLIKDYDGGTIMECYVHPSIDFTRINEIIQAQRDFILSRVRAVSKSDKVVYPPIPEGWKPNMEGIAVVRGHDAAARALSIPGVCEAGWTMADMIASTNAARESDRRKNHLKSELLSLIRKTEDQQFSWPFREPVDVVEVPDYLEVVKEPIDLTTIEKRIRRGDYYDSKKMLHADLIKMVNNCKLYNDPSSTYYECAVSLEKYLNTLFPEAERSS